DAVITALRLMKPLPSILPWASVRTLPLASVRAPAVSVSVPADQFTASLTLMSLLLMKVHVPAPVKVCAALMLISPAFAIAVSVGPGSDDGALPLMSVPAFRASPPAGAVMTALTLMALVALSVSVLPDDQFTTSLTSMLPPVPLPWAEKIVMLLD